MLRKLAFWMFLGLCCNMALAQAVTAFHTFNGADGSDSLAGLVQARDGNLYGTTAVGGKYGLGSVFRISLSGTLTTLYSFSGGNDGSNPYGQVVEGPDGNLYGTTAFNGDTNVCSGCGTIFRLTPDGSQTTLYNFRGGSGDGSHSQASLVPGSDGNLYGVTSGDANNDGTIFRISTSGTYTQLYALHGATDGKVPTAALLQAIDGNFYGVTSGGGANGEGTVFRITPSGTFTVLHTFTGSDGATPTAKLVQVASGDLIGVTSLGGDMSKCSSKGCGTLFRITTAGDFSTLYTFEDEQDGAEPVGDLFLGSTGSLYGTSGGHACSNDGTEACSTIFTIAPDGSAFTTAYSSTKDTASVASYGGLLQASDGSFYGTTAGDPNPSSGGVDSDYGTIFQLSYSPAKPAPVLMSFDQGPTPANTTIHLSWKVLNGFSTTMQQCFASVINLPPGPATAGAWTGQQTGTLVDGVYSGTAAITPTQDGLYTYALTCGGIETGFASHIVGEAPQLSITTKALPNGTVGAPYSAMLAATGGYGAYTWSILGQLPAGLRLDTATGVINGTPSVGSATNYFAATVKDSETPPATASAQLSITINPATPAVTVSVNPASIVATQSTTLTATVTGVDGIVPTGEVQFQSNGANLGSPVALSGGSATLANQTFDFPGTYAITARYSGDGNYSAATSPSATLTVSLLTATLSANPTALTLSLPGGTASTTLTLTNFAALNDIQFSCTGLPAGTVCNFGQPANSGGGTGTALMWITAQATASAMKRDSAQPALFYAITLPWLFLPFAATRRNRNRLRLCLGICGVAATLFAALMLSGCDSTAITYTAPPQTYNVTVTAASRVPTPSIYGNQTATTQVTLTVQNK